MILLKWLASQFFWILPVWALFILGCDRSSNGSSTSSSVAPVAYCSNITDYAGGYSITGTAVYEYRADGNGAVAGPNPIRFAEIRVTNSAGIVIQCGTTGSSGQFSLKLPADDSTVRVTIASRADNNYLKAYVLKDPTSNTFHSLSRVVTLDGSKTIGTLTASATGSLEGGAFNILDKIADANAFIRAETAGCSATYSGCTPFGVAPLVHAYWSPGLNPGAYFGLGPLSFYIKGEGELYILGGVNGDVDHSDTDHFDNTIILHEYGHFLEDHYSITDSPGGAHSGNTILDPRLAWGEGWANFFQAAVTGDYVYRDTGGTPEGAPFIYFEEDLVAGTKDSTTTLGEGNFREFSITRALVAIDQLTNNFSEFWTLFASSTTGLSNSSLNFRSLGLFYSLQLGLAGHSDWSQIQGDESQLATRENYGNTFSLGGGACPAIRLTPANIPDASAPQENGTPENSNQFASNDFYQYAHGGGPFNMALSYTTNSADPVDLNLYLYRTGYTFGSSNDVAGASENSISLGQSSGIESINLLSLAAGTYMININAYTGVRLGDSAD